MNLTKTTTGASRAHSELEGQIGDLLVLLLRELVFERGEELGVDLEDEALDILYDGLQVLIGVLVRPLHLFVPHVHLLDGLG